MKEINSIKIIAHRGNSGEAPENSRIAFEQALNLGVDFLECDVQLTKDNVPIILHDVSLKKVSNNKVDIDVNKLLYKEIKNLEIGSWFGEEFRGEEILSLEDFFKLTKYNSGVMLDIKEETFTKSNQIQSICNKIQNLQQKNSKILVGSLSFKIMKELKRSFKSDQLISIIEYEKEIENFLSLNTKYYAINETFLKSDVIKFFKDKEVWCWVIDDLNSAKKAINEGIKGIITNYPQKLLSALKNLND